MARNVGSMGESRFKELCDGVGLTVNKSLENDRYGWDYIVEYPHDKKLNIPLDQADSPIECKVQVKSTDKKDRKLSVRASTLYRLATSQLPAFFIFFEYDQKPDPQSAFLVHVGKDLMEKALKKVRKVEKKGELKKLSNRWITIHYHDKHRLKTISGEAIKRGIEGHVTPSFNQYTAHKLSLKTTLGYDDTPYYMNVQFSSGKNTQEDLVDFLIGLKEEMPATKIEAFSKRFGIDIKDTQLSTLENAVFTLPDLKPNLEGTLYFKARNLPIPLEFDAEIYLPSGLTMPKDQYKYRVSTQSFEMVIKGSKGTFNFNWDSEEKQPLISIKKHLVVFDLIESGRSFTPGLRFSDRDMKFREHKERPKPDYDDTDSQYFVELIDKVIAICSKRGKNPNTTETTINDLYQNRANIEHLYSFLFSPPKSVRITATIESHSPDEKIEPPRVIHGGWAFIGDEYLVYIFITHMNDETDISADKVSFYGEKIEFIDWWHGNQEEMSKIDIPGEVKRVMAELEADGIYAICPTLDLQNNPPEH